MGAYEFVNCDISSVKMVYKDADKDGYGNPNIVSFVCVTSIGYTENAGDCNDNDPNINPDATEICDEKDNDCNGSVDEEDAEGCTIYYKDNDEDGYGVDDDSRCLCSQDTNARYTVTQGGDWNEVDPNIPGNYVNADLSLPEGWSMISLPVIPDDPKVAELFPEAVVVYSYKKGVGYVRVKENDELEKGKGYWILLRNVTDHANLNVKGIVE